MTTATIHRVPAAPQLSLAEAEAYCKRLARSHYENFTVVSWLLPRHLRTSMFAVYGFCRTVDDLGDETLTPAADDVATDVRSGRLGLLDAWEEDLRRCYTGAPRHPVMQALQATIERHDIPLAPFLKLIEANRMDQRALRHATYTDLLRYCDHSANPVGQLVLYIWNYRDEERQLLADATSTALQLTNFWQDVQRDFDMGRIYLPLEDLERFGYSVEELERAECNDRFRALLAFEVQRARSLFAQGRRLVPLVGRRLRVDLDLFSQGGLSVLAAIEAQGFDVLARRPRLSGRAKARLLISTALRAARNRLGA